MADIGRLIFFSEDMNLVASSSIPSRWMRMSDTCWRWMWTTPTSCMMRTRTYHFSPRASCHRTILPTPRQASRRLGYSRRSKRRSSSATLPTSGTTSCTTHVGTSPEARPQAEEGPPGDVVQRKALATGLRQPQYGEEEERAELNRERLLQADDQLHLRQDDRADREEEKCQGRPSQG